MLRRNSLRLYGILTKNLITLIMNHLSSLIRLVFLPIVLVACNSTVEKSQEDNSQELQKSKKDTFERSYFEEQLADSLFLEKTKKEGSLRSKNDLRGKI